MIVGTIIIEDITINFKATQKNLIAATVGDTLTGASEEIIVPQDKFFKALAIAVHADGMPDYKADYADAESIMGTIRWIP